ncbi:hypothetical protein MCOR07_002533 [Pyricularia oryzae]|uniref:Clr5 domain-containing protein n=1 Tax=Pyricularia grisea TaxID=148305 RepID=A0ABQ8NE06_PYRGI|nr:hypothetical protein MCOR19_007554 [Pyricularia oryzae]KAI6295507.1 hypothetical protein MCOR33_007602 [Pyricularia grisea]KAI6270607.1 hypothetical protein MCOR26_008176 [Pyricularia oryzae]KAI6311723.1 hypothetical protein MCOR29_008211 [Pyricularia oryzae]KAI6315911.1 hypothetical protein MCOR30_009520 [Pyricularia oryzae]
MNIFPFPVRPRTDDDWEAWRTQIEHYYHDQDCELNELISKMKEHGLWGTRKQYMNRLKQWGMLKNIKAEEYEAIVQIRARRQALGKQTAFVVRKRPVSKSKIDRYVRRSRSRRKKPARPAENVSTPPDVEFWTPPLSRVSTPSPANLSPTILSHVAPALSPYITSQSVSSNIHDTKQSDSPSAIATSPLENKKKVSLVVARQPLRVAGRRPSIEWPYLAQSPVIPQPPKTPMYINITLPDTHRHTQGILRSITETIDRMALPTPVCDCGITPVPDAAGFNKVGSPECCRHVGDSTAVPERADEFFRLLFRALSLLAADEHSVEGLRFVDACLSWQFRSKRYALFRLGMMCMMQAYLQFHGRRGSARMLAMIAGFTRQLTATMLGDDTNHPVVRTLAAMRDSLNSGSFIQPEAIHQAYVFLADVLWRDSKHRWRWGLGSLTYRMGYMNTDTALTAEMRQHRLAILQGAAASLKGFSDSDERPPEALVPAYLDIAAGMVSIKQFDLAEALIGPIRIPEDVPIDFNAQSWCVLAHILEYRGQYGDAVEMLGRVTEGAEPYFLSHLVRHQASLYSRMGDSTEAGHLRKEAARLALVVEQNTMLRAAQDVV